MGGACRAYRREVRRVHDFGGKMKERDHLGDPGIDVMIIFRFIFRKVQVGLGLDQDGSE
jgi:hypothetical protein